MSVNKQLSKLHNKKRAIYTVAMAGVSLAMILAVQLLHLPNILTGIAVNSIFVVVSKRVGFRSALSIGLLSPLGGILSGHLPVVLYPLLPVIVVGNIIFIFCYALLRNSHIVARTLLPAISKASLIAGIGLLVIHQLDLGSKTHWLVFPILGIQLLTAVVGIILGEQLLQLIFTDENIS